MPGGKLSIDVAPIDDRGMRRPRHVGHISRHQPHLIHPFMAHPLRPGETLKSLGIQGQCWFNSLVQFPQLPFMYSEILVTVIPLSALHPAFVEMYTASGEDVFERTGTHLGGSGQVIANLSPANEQGHLTPGLQQQPRRWAGKIGGVSGGSGLSATSYMPYVSFATYKAATDWYDLDNTNDPQNVNWFDNPPLVSDWIRSSTTNGFTRGDAGVDLDVDAATDLTLSDLVERLYIMSRSEMTYAEILAAHGVNPKKAGGLSLPVLHRQRFLKPQSNPQIVGGGIESGSAALNNAEDNAISGGFAGHDLSSVISPDTTSSALHNVRPFGAVKADFDDRANLRKGIFIEEPSILLGTTVWYQVGMAVNEYGYMFDMTRMVGPGHWGQVQNGGIDEDDFLTVQELYQRSGDNLQAGVQGETGVNVFNMLGLFLHGDQTAIDATNGLADDVNTTGFYTAGGNQYAGNNVTCDTKLSIDIGIMSDLVGG